jgi:acetyl esterase/lipase
MAWLFSGVQGHLFAGRLAPIPSFLLLSLAAAIIALGPLGLGKARAAPPLPATTFAVQHVRDVSYVAGFDADASRHKLDLFLPEGAKDYPVVVFVHGGLWMLGDKGFFGWGPGIGECFAQQGIGAVMISYRLAPAVKYTDQVRDVARAVAWTQQHIRAYGGSPDKLFVCGHSAGGHLVSLLASDDHYLKAEGLTPAVLKGVIAVGGVYRIGAVNIQVTMTGRSLTAQLSLPETERAAGVQHSGLPAAQSKLAAASPGPLGLQLNLFGIVFGDDPKVLQDASPLCHVKRDLPPFLLVYAERDLPMLPAMAREFAAALRQAGGHVDLLEVPGRDHESVMFRARSFGDPVVVAVRTFIGQHAEPVARHP